MICFLPVVRLKELGKNNDLRKFKQAAQGLSSVDTLMAGVLYRFAIDTRCPAIFVKAPKEGDEPIPGLKFIADFDYDRIKGLTSAMFSAALDNFGTDDISWYTLSEHTFMLVKNDFVKGEWQNYGYELSGKDGVSIPA